MSRWQPEILSDAATLWNPGVFSHLELKGQKNDRLHALTHPVPSHYLHFSWRGRERDTPCGCLIQPGSMWRGCHSGKSWKSLLAAIWRIVHLKYCRQRGEPARDQFNARPPASLIIVWCKGCVRPTADGKKIATWHHYVFSSDRRCNTLIK